MRGENNKNMEREFQQFKKYSWTGHVQTMVPEINQADVCLFITYDLAQMNTVVENISPYLLKEKLMKQKK